MSALQDLASRLLEWKDVADFFDIPRLDRERFEKGREVQDLIGWLKERGKQGYLPAALQDVGRGDLLELAYQIIRTQPSEANLGTAFSQQADGLKNALTISANLSTASMEASESFQEPNSLVASLWGQPRDIRNNGTRRDVVFAAGIDCFPGVTNAILRLALHGGIQRLVVDNPDLWNIRLDKISEKCIGARCRTWRPALRSSAVERDGWRIEAMPFHEGATRDGLITYAPEILAKLLSDAMDTWVIQRMDATLAVIFEGDASILRIEISKPFLDRMKAIWLSWQLLTKNSRLVRHVLASIMISDEVSEETGLLRSGPETLDPCLLQATVFALAFEAALECRLSPQESHLPVNFELSRLDAHLVGLELVRGIQISQVTRDINWRTGIVLLTHERTPASALNNWRGLAEPGAAADFSRASERATAIFTQDTEFLRLLREDPSKLKMHLASQLVTDKVGAMVGGPFPPDEGSNND